MGQALPIGVRLGFAQRVGEALQAQGYVGADGSPEITRFATEHGFTVYNISRWLTGVIPRYHEILKLARALKVKAGWLAFGETDSGEIEEVGGAPPRRKSPRKGVPIHGGSDAYLPQESEVNDTLLSLIGHWLRDGWGRWGPPYQPWGLTSPVAAC